MLLPLALAFVPSQPIDPIRIAVDPTKPGVTVPRELFGVFFEEINQAGEGGVHAELLRDRGLVGDIPKNGILPTGWAVIPGSTEGGFPGGGDVALATDDPLNGSRGRSIRIRSGSAPIAVANAGFWGIPVRKGVAYSLALWIKSDVPSHAELAGAGVASFPSTGGTWRRVNGRFVGTVDEPKADLSISPEGVGTLQIAYASLQPAKTWRGHGLRPDLAGRVAAMEPGFFRFPGGCYIEGQSLAQAWDWKRTVGAPETRPGMARTFWGYPSSDGLGFHEYLQFCEDVGARALFVANCGLSHSDMATLDGTGSGSMSRYVQDALDAIEYANGPATSRWGAMRAKAGHPKPFGLKWVEIGNENGYSWSYGGPAAYAPRYRMMHEAIKARYPEIVTIANNPLTDGSPGGGAQDYDLLSEHYYESPAWFWRNADRYDRYPRSGPKIYVGEYAVTKGSGRGNLDGALGEAAYMTGMERNADVVRMASYAPLFENVAARQWNPNAIVFDNRRSYGTPSYWAQTMFAQNRIARVLSTQTTKIPAVPAPLGGNAGLMTWNTQAEFRDVKVERDGQPVQRGGTPPAPTGRWRVEAETISQTGPGDNRQYILPLPPLNGAKRVTMTLRARKTGGDEGFILMLGGTSEADRLQWNLGGWGNTRHAFQYAGEVQPGSIEGLRDDQKIETGRWYSLRLEREDNRVRGYIDGKLVQETTLASAPDLATIAGTAANGDLILRIVNGASTPRETAIDLGTFRAKSGPALVLSGALGDENSFETPERVAPRSTALRIEPRMTYTAPAHSLSILRLKR